MKTHPLYRIFDYLEQPATARQLIKRLRLPRLAVYRALERLLRLGAVSVVGHAAGLKQAGPKARLFKANRGV